jgi:hypothetical protein
MPDEAWQDSDVEADEAVAAFADEDAAGDALAGCAAAARFAAPASTCWERSTLAASELVRLCAVAAVSVVAERTAVFPAAVFPERAAAFGERTPTRASPAASV